MMEHSDPIEQDLRQLRRLRYLRVGAAVISGLLVSTIFAPLCWWPVAFVAMVPLLMLPQPAAITERLIIGLLFGYSAAASSLHWLNTVGFGAGYLLSIWCSLFPAAWYLLLSATAWHLKPRSASGDALCTLPGAHIGYAPSTFRSALCTLMLAASWCALEWLRSWLFSGFPWNPIGLSFGPSPWLRQSAALVGTYGLSFLALLWNLAVAEWLQRRSTRPPVVIAAALFLLSLMLFYGDSSCRRSAPATAEQTLDVLAIQGDVPECRFWNEEILQHAFRRYATLTKEGVAACRSQGVTPDILLWPESAMPAPIIHSTYCAALKALLQEVQLPILLGAMDGRGEPGQSPETMEYFNSAFILEGSSALLDNPFSLRQNYYDKMHLVPFGEYVPFSRYCPWLVRAIGMGRDLTAGRSPALLQLPKNLPGGQPFVAGVNICFEDVFPHISRQFSAMGAQVLFTITNDCWYKESAGAAQHREHARFRAIENRRYLMRSGNNSDTCLITPSGELIAPIVNPDTGSAFTRGFHLYRIPVSTTADHRNFSWLFVALCVSSGVILCHILLRSKFSFQRRMMEISRRQQPTEKGGNQKSTQRTGHNTCE